jgi:hypothetical protein
MTDNDPQDELKTGITRRHLVATGTKLAYVAPLAAVVPAKLNKPNGFGTVKETTDETDETEKDKNKNYNKNYNNANKNKNKNKSTD